MIFTEQLNLWNSMLKKEVDIINMVLCEIENYAQKRT